MSNLNTEMSDRIFYGSVAGGALAWILWGLAFALRVDNQHPSGVFELMVLWLSGVFITGLGSFVGCRIGKRMNTVKGHQP